MKITRQSLITLGLMASFFSCSCSERPGIASQAAGGAGTLFFIELSFPAGAYSQPEQRRNFVQQVLSRIKALPEVESVAAAGTPPRQPQSVVREYDPGKAELNYSAVTPDYFFVLNLALLKGRQFEEREGPNTPAVIILSESTARRLFPDEDPMGKRFAFSEREGRSPWAEVVGVVADEPESSTRPRTEIYRPYSQDPDAAVELVVRAKSNTPTLAEKLRAEILAVDKQVTLSKVQSR